jgi:hypothetical protein
MDHHGGINCMWVLHILIESPTYIQLIVSKMIGNYYFYISLNSHKRVAWFFFSICKLLLVYGLW